MKKSKPSGHSLSSDIQSWSSGIAQMRDRMGRSKEDRKLMGARSVRLERPEPRLVYALLTEFISARPNGIYTLLAKGFPADNLIWWDFVLGLGPHVFTVLSGVNGLSAEIYSVPDGFDVERFLLQNIERHRARVQARANAFERHEVYANHFYSYRRSVEWLKKQVAETNTDVPAFPGGFFESDEEAKRALKEAGDFATASIRFHVLAKTLLVNAAFMCEALVSTLLRVGALPPLRQDPSTLRPVLRASFMQRVEVLHAYTFLFAGPVDLKVEPVAGVRRLMERRNKFVHAEFSDHTRLKDVHFDGDVPLYGGGAMGQLAEFTTRTYLSPTKQDVLGEADVAERFCEHVLGSIRPELRKEMEFMLKQPQLGYNTTKRMYSVPFPSTPFQSVMSPGPRGETVVAQQASQPGPSADGEADRGTS